jgi:hypothetical protein
MILGSGAPSVSVIDGGAVARISAGRDVRARLSSCTQCRKIAGHERPAGRLGDKPALHY